MIACLLWILNLTYRNFGASHIVDGYCSLASLFHKIVPFIISLSLSLCFFNIFSQLNGFLVCANCFENKEITLIHFAVIG